MLEIKGKNGFSLVELALVITIIGLVLAGVLAAREMIKNAETRAVIAESSDHLAAVDLFQEKYQALPGDMPDAASVIGDTGGDGNGNGEVAGSEVLRAWRHLALGSIIPGSYAGTGNYSIADDATKTLPGSKVTGGAYRIVYASSTNRVEFGAINGASVSNSIITSQNAWSIDRKADDGVAATGIIRALAGSNGTANKCIDGSSVYVLNDAATKDSNQCYMAFNIVVKQ